MKHALPLATLLALCPATVACGGADAERTPPAAPAAPEPVAAPVAAPVEDVEAERAPPADPRLVEARQHVEAQRWRDALDAYRAILGAPETTPSLAAEAELALVGAWLAREASEPFVPTCAAPAQAPAVSRRAARDHAHPLLLAARRDARALLRCAAERGAEATAIAELAARLDALDERDRAECGARGETAELDSDRLPLGSADPCRAPASIDRRLGAASPFADVLAPAAFVDALGSPPR